ncbi:MAG: DUF1499 domain-containing protein [Pseudomonadales bacterium]
MPDPIPDSIEQLESCPASPNCVCSTDTDRSHYIEPLQLSGDAEQAWQALLELLQEDGSITVVHSNSEYIRAEAKTRLLRFTDDLEFLLNRELGVIDVRSASRLGYSDLGKNRRRLEGIRTAFARENAPQ